MNISINIEGVAPIGATTSTCKQAHVTKKPANGPKKYEELNEAEQTIIDYLQQAEHIKFNSKDYEPVEDIITLREIAERLNLIDKRPQQPSEFGEVPF